MKNLFLTYRDGTSSLLSVPDDFDDLTLEAILRDDNAYLSTFDSGDDQVGTVTLAIRGSDIRTAVLTEGGNVQAQPAPPPEPLLGQDGKPWLGIDIADMPGVGDEADTETLRLDN